MAFIWTQNDAANTKNINFFRDTHAKPWLQVTILVQQFFGGLRKYNMRGEAQFESRFTNMEHHIELELESFNIDIFIIHQLTLEKVDLSCSNPHLIPSLKFHAPFGIVGFGDRKSVV